MWFGLLDNFIGVFSSSQEETKEKSWKIILLKRNYYVFAMCKNDIAKNVLVRIYMSTGRVWSFLGFL